MENVSSFQEGMKAKYPVSEIMKARWIKPRSEDHTAWLLTINSDTLHEIINIPGEQIFTKVYPYKDKPIICRKCQQYSHSIKYCQTAGWTCGKCGDAQPAEECTNERLLYVHCASNHWTGHKSCCKQMEEQEILDIQLTDKISRGLARQKYYTRDPERGESFANEVTEPRAGKVTTDVTRPAGSVAIKQLKYILRKLWKIRPW